MRSLLIVLAVTITAWPQAKVASPSKPAAMPSIEELYTRPYIWGTSPTTLKWSRNGQVLLFLWNAEGRRFRDLYAWDVGTKKLSRLSDLEQQKDELNVAEAEKDDKLKRYLMPPPGLSAFSMSDDGKLATFSYKGDLYLVRTDKSEPPLRLTRTKAVESSPVLSAGGDKLASLRGGQIVVQNLQSGQIWQATDVTAGSLTNFSWSPDGKYFAYQVETSEGRQLPLPNYSGAVVTTRNIPRSVAGDEPTSEQVFIVAVDGGPAKPIDRGDDKATLTDLKWSPDSRKLLIAQMSADFKKRQVGVAEVAAPKMRVIFEETDARWVDYGSVAWAPNSESVLFTSDRDGWAHLYTVALSGGTPRQLTKGNFEIRTESFSEDPQWAADWIYFSSNEGNTAHRQFYRVSPDGARKEKLSSTLGLSIGLVSEDGKNVALRRADETNPFDLYVNNEPVTRSPQQGFEHIPWPEVRYVSFPSRGDKKPVRAKLLLPRGYNPTDKRQKPRPAVVYIHGAGIATSVLEQWGSYNELRYVFNAWLTAQGYPVLDIDYRGSTGYGRDWRTDVYLHMGGKDLDDVLGGLDYLGGLANIDMKRVGIWGVSYGGFMTNMALFQSPGSFKAGVSWAAVNDWANYNAGYTGQRLNTPDKNPEAYRRSSPITFSNQLQDKLLIVHGMVDDNVLFQDAVQLTDKLIQERKDFSQAFYPQESHGFIRDETWIDALRRTGEWFERHLK